MCVFGRFSRIHRTLQVLPNVGLLGGKMGANCLFIPFFCTLSEPNTPYILPLSVLSLFVFILSTRAHISFCLAVLFFSLYAPIYFNPVSLFSHRSWLKFCMCLWSRCSSLHPPHCLRETGKNTVRKHKAMRALVQIPAFVVMAWTHKSHVLMTANHMSVFSATLAIKLINTIINR